jgi:hypothetical protein
LNLYVPETHPKHWGPELAGPVGSCLPPYHGPVNGPIFPVSVCLANFDDCRTHASPIRPHGRRAYIYLLNFTHATRL